MSSIDTNRLREIIVDVFPRKDEILPTGGVSFEPIDITAITTRVFLHPERLKQYEDEVREMLSNIPFTDDGISYEDFCFDNNQVQWADPMVCEELMILGLGLNIIQYTCEREDWSALPNGLPYLIYTQQ